MTDESDITGGPMTTRTLRDGGSWREVGRRAKADQLARVWRGAYLPAIRAGQLVDQLRGLRVSSGQIVIAAQATAALLEGFGVIDDRRIHVTTPDGRSLRQRPGLVVHQSPPRLDPVVIDGVLATHPADTAIDLACAVEEVDVLPVLDAAMRADLSADDLWCAVKRARCRRGLRKVRTWLPYADWRADSPMESRTRYRFLAAGLPAPDLQVPVRLPDGSFRYLDHGWRKYRVGADFDGREAHLGKGERDRARHNDLTDEGWRMYYPTGQTIYRGYHELIRMVAKALRGGGYDGPIGRLAQPDTVPRPAPGPASAYLDRPRHTWSAARPVAVGPSPVRPA